MAPNYEILSHDDDFHVSWVDPERNNESWVHDRLHAPWAMPPLTQAFFVRIMDLAFDVPTVFVNNFGGSGRPGNVWPSHATLPDSAS